MPLLPEAEDRAQALRAQGVQALRKLRYEHRPRLDSSDYALSGRAMKADSVPARADAGDGYQRRRYRRYTCTGWKQNRDCSMHFLRAELVEQAVFDFLAEQVLLSEHLLQVLQDAQPDDEERRALEQDAQLLKGTLADVDQGISRLVDAIERSGHSTGPTRASRSAANSRDWQGSHPFCDGDQFPLTAPAVPCAAGLQRGPGFV